MLIIFLGLRKTGCIVCARQNTIQRSSMWVVISALIGSMVPVLESHLKCLKRCPSMSVMSAEVQKKMTKFTAFVDSHMMTLSFTLGVRSAKTGSTDVVLVFCNRRRKTSRSTFVQDV